MTASITSLHFFVVPKSLCNVRETQPLIGVSERWSLRMACAGHLTKMKGSPRFGGDQLHPSRFLSGSASEVGREIVTEAFRVSQPPWPWL